MFQPLIILIRVLGRERRPGTKVTPNPCAIDTMGPASGSGRDGPAYPAFLSTKALTTPGPGYPTRRSISSPREKTPKVGMLNTS